MAPIQENTKRERSRNKIIHAAKILFERDGLSNVTFSDIGREANMCRTTVFNHFPTMNDLYLALAEQEYEDAAYRCQMSRKQGKEAILEIFYQLIEDAAKYPTLVNTLLSAMIASDRKEKLVMIEKLILENLPSGTKREKEKKVVQLTGIFYGIINHQFINNIPFDARKMKKQFTELAEVCF